MSGATSEDLDVLVARLRQDAAALASAAGGDLADVDAVRAAGLHREIRSLGDQLGLASAALLARVEAEGTWAAAGGARTFPEWVARRSGTSVGAARREATLGQAMAADLPATREAVASGAVTLEHAQVLARIGPTSPGRRAALASDLPDRNEAYLLARARAVGVDDFRREAARWAASVDAAATEREHERATAKEYLSIARRDDGMALQGFLTHEHGTALVTALRAVTGVPAADDDRTPQQRDGAALSTVARLVLDQGLSGGGAQVRPHLSVHVSWETLQRLSAEAGDQTSEPADVSLLAAAELETGEPLPRSVLDRLACDSDISRVVFGPAGQVLDVGRAHRTYTGRLRRAVVARDRTCRYPSCSAPPSLGEVHHVEHWARGGPTSVVNGILLCWYHHDLVHRRHLRIHARVGGGWDIRRSDGTPLRDENLHPPGAAHAPPDETHPSPDETRPPPGAPQPSPDTSQPPLDVACSSLDVACPHDDAHPPADAAPTSRAAVGAPRPECAIPTAGEPDLLDLLGPEVSRRAS